MPLQKWLIENSSSLQHRRETIKHRINSVTCLFNKFLHWYSVGSI